MNREIKFRGISIDEWVYGMLCKVNEGDTEHGEPIKYKIQTDEKEYGEYVKCFITDENTIGQYTGLHDENGKEIYEGDIIEFSYDVFTGNFDTKVGRGTVEFIDGAFYIKPFEIEGKKIKDTDNEEWFLLYTVNTDTLKVLGNVHENLELLGGE